jgi:hypothetical protein
MLGYLQANSLPDITFAFPIAHASQTLRDEAMYSSFCSNLSVCEMYHNKRSHFCPSPLTSLLRDVAGGWGYETPNDPICVKSRTGFLIEVRGCLIQSTSKIQAFIATSTMEAEFTALSVALRSANPLLEPIRYVIGFKVT